MNENSLNMNFDTVEGQLTHELDAFRKLLGIVEVGEIEKKIKSDIVKILETRPLQSLRDRYQLGLIYRVFPKENAKHTRFDHTVGVVAKCIITSDLINLNSKADGFYFSETDVRELAVAAALHDCGHLPVSHATERAFLTARGLKTGITHEERILPLIVNRNPYFDDLRTLVLGWSNFNENSFYRIAAIISPDSADEYERKIKHFVKPKRAIQQLLVSEIDMDRLDYIMRDATQLNYLPVSSINDKLVSYVTGLTLVKYKSLNQEYSENDLELCLNEKKKESVFNLLVCRVLLYKYVYFSEKVRCFEAILTYLVGTFIDKNIALEPLKLIAMSDDYFIETYLDKLASFVENENNFRTHLIDKYIKVLKNDKVERFKLLMSIHDEDIVNPRLREEFVKNINKRSYIDNLRSYLNKSAKKHGIDLERGDILLDVFHLKTGGGSLLIKQAENNFKTLSNFMNGSNMHRLCSEIRLDIYIKSDLGDRIKDAIVQELTSFFKNI